MNVVYVFKGGGLGSVFRFAISEWVKSNFKGSFPIATSVLFSHLFIHNLLYCKKTLTNYLYEKVYFFNSTSNTFC